MARRYGLVRGTEIDRLQGIQVLPPIWYFAVRLGLQVEQRKRLPGQEKIVPRWRLRRLPLQELLLHGMWGGSPQGCRFTLERRKGQPTPKAPDGNGGGGIGKPITNDKITDQSAFRCMGTSESVASAYVPGPTNYGTMVAAGLLSLAVLVALIGIFAIKGNARMVSGKAQVNPTGSG